MELLLLLLLLLLSLLLQLGLLVLFFKLLWLWLVWLVFGIMTGITQGFSILVAQFYGAREKENLKCAVAKSYIMTALLSVIVLAVSEGAVYHVLLFLQTPDNVIDLTMLYLRLIFAGIPIIAAYNIFAAILRALGNSRSPLIAMTVAALINVGLDLLFVAVFGWGVAGAAVATGDSCRDYTGAVGCGRGALKSGKPDEEPPWNT